MPWVNVVLPGAEVAGEDHEVAGPQHGGQPHAHLAGVRRGAGQDPGASAVTTPGARSPVAASNRSSSAG